MSTQLSHNQGTRNWGFTVALQSLTAWPWVLCVLQTTILILRFTLEGTRNVETNGRATQVPGIASDPDSSQADWSEWCSHVILSHKDSAMTLPKLH